MNIFEFEALDCLGFIYVTKVLLPLSCASLSGSKQIHNLLFGTTQPAVRECDVRFVYAVVHVALCFVEGCSEICLED